VPRRLRGAELPIGSEPFTVTLKRLVDFGQAFDKARPVSWMAPKIEVAKRRLNAAVLVARVWPRYQNDLMVGPGALSGAKLRCVAGAEIAAAQTAPSEAQSGSRRWLRGQVTVSTLRLRPSASPFSWNPHNDIIARGPGHGKTT